MMFLGEEAGQNTIHEWKYMYTFALKNVGKQYICMYQCSPEKQPVKYREVQRGGFIMGIGSAGYGVQEVPQSAGYKSVRGQRPGNQGAAGLSPRVRRTENQVF